MNFPSLAAAETYLKNTLQDFYNQRGVLTGRLTAIVKLKDAAIKADNQPAIGQLIVMREGVMSLLREHMALEERLEPFRGYFGVHQYNPALGVLPLVMAGGALAVATSLYLYYEKLKNQGKALDLVAKGILPAEQAESILNPGLFSGGLGQVSSILMLAVGGYALFLFGPMLSTLLGGRKS